MSIEAGVDAVAGAARGKPIAVVGLACRLPGAPDPDAFLRLLTSGTDAVGAPPAGRPEFSGAGRELRGGFLDRVDEFDPAFFGISPREAAGIDPQQRLALELAWEALEYAGIVPGALSESDAGVFVGAIWDDYAKLAHAAGEEAVTHTSITGLSRGIIANRLSYFLKLRGPSIVVDSGQSSALVAVHLACESLRRGESHVALAGGVSLNLTADGFTVAERFGALSPDGLARTFDAGANGYVRGEGGGFVVLKPLDQALADNDTVHAVIRGSAVNNDGGGDTLTAPRGLAQEDVLRRACREAGVTPADVDFVELHGTGTPVGDPIEAAALGAVLGHGRDPGSPLLVGSVKTNIGHLEGAAGIAGLLKAILCLRERTLAPSLHFTAPNPAIALDTLRLRVNDTLLPLAAPGERPLTAGVSSFGMGGTNCHVVLSEGPRKDAGTRPDPVPLPVLLSGRSAGALRDQAARLRQHIEAHPGTDLDDLAHTLAVGRTHFAHRAALSARDRDGLVDALARQAASADSRPGAAGGLAFLFTGQGSQYPGMGRALHRNFPVFAEAFDAACTELDRHLAGSVRDLVLDPGSVADPRALDLTGNTQPALFAYETALFRLLESWDLAPGFLLGHSVGELAAAHVSGMLSLADAAALVAARGTLMQDLPPGGAMVSVQAAEEEVAAELGPFAGRVEIAAVNGPSSLVLSGDEDAVVALAESWRARGRRTKRLRVSHAFHSPHMEPMLARFREVAAGITYRAPHIPVVSNVLGRVADGAEMAHPDYWVRHAREGVRFLAGMRALEAAGVRTFLEVGPDAVLASMGRDCVTAGDAVLVPAARAGKAEPRALTGALGALHTRGVPIDWRRVGSTGAAGPRRVPLPAYAFQRDRHWLAAPAPARDLSAAGLGSVDHPLLGAVVARADAGEFVLTGRLSGTEQPWLAGQRPHGRGVVPATTFLELALRAGAESAAGQVTELRIDRPLVLPAEGALQLQVVVGTPDGAGARPFGVHVRPERTGAGWVRHAGGTLAPAPRARPGDSGEWPPRDAVRLDPPVGDALPGAGDAPSLAGLSAAWRRDGELFAEVDVPEAAGSGAERFAVHPVLLEAALSLVAPDRSDAARPRSDAAQGHPGEASRRSQEPAGTGQDDLAMPGAWDGVVLHATGAARLRVRLTPRPDGAWALSASDPSGHVVLTAASVRHRSYAARDVAPSAAAGSELYQVRWQEAPGPAVTDAQGEEPASGAHAAVVGTDRWGLADALASGAGEVRTHTGLAALLDAGGPAPEVVFVLSPPEDEHRRADEAVRATTASLGAWFAAPLSARSRLVLVGERAVSTDAADAPPLLARAAAWGAARALQSAHPGRLTLLDIGPGHDAASLLAAVADHDEPELALREGRVRVPRLASVAEGAPGAAAWECGGTVLITGGTRGPGAEVARALATGRAVRRLLLVGPGADSDPAAAALVAELSAHGVRAVAVGGDPSVREDLAAVVAGQPGEHPLTAVVHAWEPQDVPVDRLMAAATHLHELTAGHRLSDFVLLSSHPGDLDGPADRAALGAHLSGLALARHADGLPALALALPAAAFADGRAQGADDVVRAVPAWLDGARSTGLAALRYAHIDRAPARSTPPALLSALVHELPPPAERRTRPAAAVPADGGPAPEGFAARVRARPESEREEMIKDVVRAHARAVLELSDADDIDGDRSFKDLGFDSLMGVEFRDRLAAATGLALPSTLVFDHPTAASVTALLRAEVLGAAGEPLAEPPRDPVAHRTEDDPIAVVAMSCRYPGGIASPEDLWQVVSEGRDVVGPFPTDRGWDLKGTYDPEGTTPGKHYVREGGFLAGAAEFDEAFFGISPREATAMDPQQRLVLEIAWEALERGGLDPRGLTGTPTGVFVGTTFQDYGPRLAEGTPDTEGYLMTGSTPSVVSGRVAYTLGLEGPAVTVDTACSASLVALHLACQSLRQGESTLALAGGVTVMATQGVFVELTRQRALSPDGRCKAFSASADGTGWAEGAGMLLLERLSDARRNGHPVLALVKGSATNQDGASNGLTAPSGPAQQRVIRRALSNARLTAAEVDAVEAHGTGTRLGDPVEAHALLATYGRAHSAETPLWLGSVKSNLGHTQAAAGVAGVIKMVQAMRHGVLPQTLHAEEPSPRIDWDSGAVSLLTRQRAWPDTGRPRRAGVSSFGISGTNAHVILEQVPAQAREEREEPAAGPYPWVLSAQHPEALRAQAGRLGSHVAGAPSSPADVAAALATTRTAFRHRAVVVAEDIAGFRTALDALARDEAAATAVRGTAEAGGRTVFVFPGQGSQWAGMAARLLDEEPEFARQLAVAAAAVEAHVPWSVTAVLREEEGAPALDRIEVVQPVLFAVHVALAGLWQAHGVTPDAVVGHSQGEVAAAYVAGALSLEDAARVAVVRSRLYADALVGHGAVASVALPRAAVEPRLLPYADRLSVAGENSPGTVTVAGETKALEEFVATLREEGERARVVPATVASHSPQVEPLRERLAALLSFVRPRTGTVPLYSTVTGEVLKGPELTAEYWYENCRRPVGFLTAVRALLADGFRTFVETSAHPVLTMSVEETADTEGVTAAVIGTLRRNAGDRARFLTSLGEAWAHGLPVDWRPALGAGRAEGVTLPTYAFRRKRFWAREGTAPAPAAGFGPASDHPLVGAVVPLAESEGLVLGGRIGLDEQPWLADHAALGTVLLPGAALVELALQAGERAGSPVLADLTLESPVLLPAEGGRLLQVTVGAPDSTGHRPLSVHSRPDADTAAGWTRHATGLLAPEGATEPDEGLGMAGTWPPPGAEPVPLDGWYRTLAESGYVYGPAFRGLVAAWRRDGDVFAELALPEGESERAGRFALHPALLDSALHAIELGALPGTGDTRLPFAWSDVRLYATGATRARVRVTADGPDGVRLDLTDAAGRPLARVASMTRRPVAARQLSGYADNEALFAVEWTPLTLPAAPAGEPWPVVADEDAEDLVGPGRPRHSGPDSVPGDAAGVLVVRTGPGDVADQEAPEALARATTKALALLKDWLADPRREAARLVLVTRGAVATVDEEDVADLPHAAVWGLVGSAQSEHPGRITLVDVDGTAASWRALPAALASAEPRIALREGRATAPRLVRATPGDRPAPWTPEGTVLITGGTGALGRLTARHLAARHGVRHLLLASRSGPAAPGADTLVAELAAAGAEAHLVRCDIADPEAVRELLAGIPASRPLTAVVHTAGVLDDATLAAQTPERLVKVLRPKAEAAWRLHALTRDAGLAAFVSFSSVQGLFGGAGQANYAAASAYLDALAHRRRAAGAAGTSLAWGLWEEGGMEAALSETDRARLARASGMTALTGEEGMRLFDAALATGRTVVVPARLDLAALRGATSVPALLSGLARPAVRRPAASSGTAGDRDGAEQGADTFGSRMLALPPAERDKALIALVRAEAAAVLNHETAQDIGSTREFKELGFDSLTAVELRNRLGRATGLRLPATSVFDHPTPEALAHRIGAELAPPPESDSPAGAAEPRRVAEPEAGPDERLIDSLDVDELIRLAGEGLGT
ncbi:SDR family NAD(P)-dependent oxidoreductase [Streptomyces sp. P6-2-1]|uniref:SDR family NAD(P)-dependent oxidoreductase n=1 Tax=Streptomyces sp. P6-2-1 TaxID=3422591 RepID=UPI003D36993D